MSALRKGAWLLAPALVYLAASMLLSRGLLWCAVVLGLPDGQSGIVASALASVVLAPCALLWDWRDQSGSEGTFVHPSPLPALMSLGAGLLLGLATALLLKAPADPALNGPGWLIALRALALCVTGPLCEEAVYRGLVLRRGEALLGAVPAALLTAALFAAGHGDIAQLLPAFVAGLAFAAVALCARRAYPPRWALLCPFLCHAAANAAQLCRILIFHA